MAEVSSAQFVPIQAQFGVPQATPPQPQRSDRPEATGDSAPIGGSSREVAFTAKFSNGETGLRVVRGDEVQAVETSDIGALLNIRLSQQSQEALVQAQEVEAAEDAQIQATANAAAETEAAEEFRVNSEQANDAVFENITTGSDASGGVETDLAAFEGAAEVDGAETGAVVDGGTSESVSGPDFGGLTGAGNAPDSARGTVVNVLV